MNEVLEFLQNNNIEFVLHEHPAVFTCEEADEHCGKIPGLSCKCLFMRDKNKKRYFLYLAPAFKRIDLKNFEKIVNAKKISFANENDLFEKLKLKPGSVSPFGLLNNSKKDVELFIDQEVYNADIVGFHPNVNTATLEMKQEDFRKVFGVLGYEYKVF